MTISEEALDCCGPCVYLVRNDLFILKDTRVGQTAPETSQQEPKMDRAARDDAIIRMTVAKASVKDIATAVQMSPAGVYAALKQRLGDKIAQTAAARTGASKRKARNGSVDHAQAELTASLPDPPTAPPAAWAEEAAVALQHETALVQANQAAPVQPSWEADGWKRMNLPPVGGLIEVRAQRWNASTGLFSYRVFDNCVSVKAGVDGISALDIMLNYIALTEFGWRPIAWRPFDEARVTPPPYWEQQT